MLHGFAVADLTDQDDIRCFSHRILHCIGIAECIQPHLPLVNHRLFVLVDKFHRFLNCEDMATLVLVPVFQH